MCLLLRGGVYHTIEQARLAARLVWNAADEAVGRGSSLDGILRHFLEIKNYRLKTKPLPQDIAVSYGGGEHGERGVAEGQGGQLEGLG